MKSKINIKNSSPECVVIDIEGVIGVPEKMQFELPEKKVATYEKFKTQVEKIARISASEVVVNIRSAGGNVNDALLIYDSLRRIDGVVTTNCFGYVASAATIIAQAASQGRRFVSASSLYLIHNSMSNCEGNSEQILQVVELLRATDETIANLYASRSGRGKEVFAALMAENSGNGRWLSPEEVIDAGLADVIADAPKIENQSTRIVSQLGLPPLPDGDVKLSLSKRVHQRWNEFVESIEEIVERYDDAPVEVDSLTEQVADLPLDIAVPLPEKMVHKCDPTQVMQIEDPSLEEFKQRPNEFAYGEDVKQFK